MLTNLPPNLDDPEDSADQLMHAEHQTEPTKNSFDPPPFMILYVKMANNQVFVQSPFDDDHRYILLKEFQVIFKADQAGTDDIPSILFSNSSPP